MDVTDRTIPGLLALRASDCGDLAAVITDSGTLSWAELHNLSLRMSAKLRAEGIVAGDHVALLCGNNTLFLVAWFGLANLGAVTVSLNTSLMGDSLRYALMQSEAVAVVIGQSTMSQRQPHEDEFFSSQRTMIFDEESGLAKDLSRFAPDDSFVGTAEDPVSLIYTSGTTGLPKGVINCHEAFVASGELMVQSLRISRQDRIMICLPLYHTNPQMYAVMSALHTGCSLVIRPRFSVRNFFPDARRYGCTVFTYVGTMLAMLASRITDYQRDHLLTRGVGGGCPAEVWKIMTERFGITPYELYGMTEIGGWVTGNSTTHYRFGSCGRARPDMTVAILDKNDNVQPAQVPGEIAVRPNEPFRLMLGYWKNPQATLDASRNLWFHTGDVGTIDDGGYLFFHGRMKEIIRRGGENISPTEVEIALLKCRQIKDVAVVGVHDEIYGQEIKALIVPNGTISPGELVSFFISEVPRHMMPSYVEFVEAIPRTETQKIQRHLLSKDIAMAIDLRGSIKASSDKNLNKH